MAFDNDEQTGAATLNPISRRKFGALLLGGAAVSACSTSLGGCAASSGASRRALPYSGPAEQGVDSQIVLDFLDEA
ncbi:MAG TPA: hypothetical protein VNR40_17155, partial [Steroidobacter sp.]|nr:hypothetical protein [Steroidobacter sp.]